MKDGVSVLAPDHEFLIAIGEADHLQFEIILIGPEPWRKRFGNWPSR